MHGYVRQVEPSARPSPFVVALCDGTATHGGTLIWKADLVLALDNTSLPFACENRINGVPLAWRPDLRGATAERFDLSVAEAQKQGLVDTEAVQPAQMFLTARAPTLFWTVASSTKVPP